MPHDIVDRILATQAAESEARNISQRIELERLQAVRENSGPLWTDVVAALHRLVQKYNSLVRNELQVSHPRAISERLEIRRIVYPIASLILVRSSDHFWQYWTSRAEGPFSPTSEDQGRIELRADELRNVYLTRTSDASVFPNSTTLADALLEPIISPK